MTKKAQTVPQAVLSADKPLPILRNPYLDGVDPLIRARQTGASSLRIDRKSPASVPKTALPPVSPLAITRPT